MPLPVQVMAFLLSWGIAHFLALPSKMDAHTARPDEKRPAMRQRHPIGEKWQV